MRTEQIPFPLTCLRTLLWGVLPSHSHNINFPLCTGQFQSAYKYLVVSPIIRPKTKILLHLSTLVPFLCFPLQQCCLYLVLLISLRSETHFNQAITFSLLKTRSQMASPLLSSVVNFQASSSLHHQQYLTLLIPSPWRIFFIHRSQH